MWISGIGFCLCFSASESLLHFHLSGPLSTWPRRPPAKQRLMDVCRCRLSADRPAQWRIPPIAQSLGRCWWLAGLTLLSCWVGWFLVVLRPSNMQSLSSGPFYFDDCSCCHSDTELAHQLAISSSHRILSSSLPVPALTQQH